MSSLFTSTKNIAVKKWLALFLLIYDLSMNILLHQFFVNNSNWLYISQLTFTCLKLTTETLEKGVKYVQSQWRRSGVFIVNAEHISHLFIVLLLSTLNK